jgi:hypothetical protein
MVMQYSAKANDKASAQRLLMEAGKAAGAASDYVERTLEPFSC